MKWDFFVRMRRCETFPRHERRENFVAKAPANAVPVPALRAGTGTARSTVFATKFSCVHDGGMFRTTTCEQKNPISLLFLPFPRQITSPTALPLNGGAGEDKSTTATFDAVLKAMASRPSFGDKGHVRRRGACPSHLQWTPGSTRPNTPASPKATPMSSATPAAWRACPCRRSWTRIGHWL